MVKTVRIDPGVLKRGDVGIAFGLEWDSGDVWSTLPVELHQLFNTVEDLVVNELCTRCEPDCGPHCPVYNMLRFIRAAATCAMQQYVSTF